MTTSEVLDVLGHECSISSFYSTLINSNEELKTFITNAMLLYAREQIKLDRINISKNVKVKAYIKKNQKGSRYKELKFDESYNPFETTQMFKIDKSTIINAPSIILI